MNDYRTTTKSKLNVCAVMFLTVVLLSSAFMVFVPRASAAVTAGQTAGLVANGQRIRDDSSCVAVMGWGATDAGTAGTLTGVTVTYVPGGFGNNPANELEALSTDQTTSGVAIYADTSTAGANGDVLDSGDTALGVVTAVSAWAPAGFNYVTTFTINNYAVPDNANGNYEWFIVVRTAPGLGANAQFQIRLNVNAITYSGAVFQPAGQTTTNNLAADKTRTVNLVNGGGGGQWIGNSTVQVNQADTLGIRIVDGGAGDVIDSMDLTIVQMAGTITSSDFLALNTNSSKSGIGLYRDDGATDDAWDGTDSYITLTAITGTWGNPTSTISMDLNAEPVPNAATGNYDFFLVVRMSATIVTGDNFRLELLTNNMNVDGTVDTNTLTPENDYNDNTLQTDTTLPSINSGAWTENSAYTWVNGTGVLFFSSLMPAAVNVVVSGTANDANSGNNRMEFSNEAHLATSPGNDNSANTWSGTYTVNAASSDADKPVNVTLFDNVGNNVSRSFPYIEDNIAPVIKITNPGTGDHLGGAVTITTKASDALTAVNAIDISTDYGTTWTTMVWDGNNFVYTWNTGANPDGAARIAVRAYDMVSNEGMTTVNVNLDNTGPVVTPTNPMTGDYVGLGSTVKVWASATDATSINMVQMSIDKSAWKNASFDYLALQWYINWTVASPGFHLIEYRGIDGLGNVGGASSIYIYADGTPPLVNVVSPTDASDLSGRVIVQLEANDLQRLGDVEFSMDQGISWYMAVLNPSTGYFEYTWDTTTVKDGRYSLWGNAHDAAGNLGIDQDTTVLVDNTAPDMQVTSPLANDVVGGLYNITAAVFDDGSGAEKAEYRVDGGSWGGMQLANDQAKASWATDLVKDGPHGLELRVWDMAGNSAVRTLQVTVDNTVPDCTMVEPGEGQYVSGVFRFTIHVADNIGVGSVALAFSGESSIANAGTIWASFSQADGVYQYTVDTVLFSDGKAQVVPTAYDLAGNSVAGVAVNFNINNWPAGVTIVTPSSGAVVDKTTKLEVKLTETFISKVEYQIDEGPWSELSAPSWSTDINTLKYSDGEHAISVRATDNSSRVTVEKVKISIDNTPPEVVIVAPLSGQTVEGIQVFHVAASDIVQVKAVNITVGTRAPSAMVYNLQTGQYDYTMDTTELTDGTYSVKVSAKDPIDHIASMDISIKVLNEPAAPSGLFVTPTKGQHVSGIFEVEVMAKDEKGIAKVELSIAGGAKIGLAQDLSTGHFATMVDTTALTNGDTALDVTVTNIASKTTVISTSAFIDNAGPSITGLSVSQTGSGEIRVKASVSDPSGIKEVQYSIDGGAWQDMSLVGTTYTAYWHSDAGDNGKHMIEVRTVDTLGNEAKQSKEVTVNNFDWASTAMIILVVLVLILAVVALFLAAKRGGGRKGGMTSGGHDRHGTETDRAYEEDTVAEPQRPKSRAIKHEEETGPLTEDDGEDTTEKKDK